MLTFACSLALALSGVNCPIQGVASRYDEIPTKATLELRIEWGHITPKQLKTADSFIAVQDCSRIGETVYFAPVGGEVHEAVVFDCATRGDAVTADFMQHVEFEVDYYTAQFWGFDCECGYPVWVLENE